MIKNLSEKKGEEVMIKGWIDTVRDQGKMAFFDFRDASGKVQGVVFGKPEVLEIAKTLRPEWVVAVSGKVQERNDKQAKAYRGGLAETGKTPFFNKDVELEITGFEILNKAETPVFEITKDTRDMNEEVRLKNRYLDLRTERMQKNIRMRAKAAKFLRDELEKENFIEIETHEFNKRPWKVEGLSVRPEMWIYNHSAFIVSARKVKPYLETLSELKTDKEICED